MNEISMVEIEPTWRTQKSEAFKAAPRKNWRLRKTLARRVSFRPIEEEDVRFAYAGYKKGALAPMAGIFAQFNMSAEEFSVAFPATVTTRYHGAWTLFAEAPKRGFVPVGMVMAFYSHAEHALSPFMIIGDIVWFPWASARNKIEAAVNFFSIMRKKIPMMDFAHGDENQRFFEMMAKHGIVRRVGTTLNVVAGKPTAIFETRIERDD